MTESGTPRQPSTIWLHGAQRRVATPGALAAGYAWSVFDELDPAWTDRRLASVSGRASRKDAPCCAGYRRSPTAALMSGRANEGRRGHTSLLQSEEVLRTGVRLNLSWPVTWVGREGGRHLRALAAEPIDACDVILDAVFLAIGLDRTGYFGGRSRDGGRLPSTRTVTSLKAPSSS